MKQYQSVTEGQWVEILPVQLTEEQKALMMSTKEEDNEAKKELAQLIKSQREKAVDQETLTNLNKVNDSVKPKLKDGDVYELISFDLSQKDGLWKGILNCRVNGEHKQVRL